MHSIRRATLPPNFAAPEDGTSPASCARTCNVFSRVRRENRPKSRNIVAIRGLDSPSVDIPENPVKIGSSYRIGLRNVAEKNPPRISEFQLGISFHQSQKCIAARARDSVYAIQERRIDLAFFLRGALTKGEKSLALPRHQPRRDLRI